MASHQCPVTGCTRRVQSTKLLCSQHWALVSARTGQQVYATYRKAPLGPKHLAAMKQAIAEANAAVGVRS
jgi:hypothetical protein